MDRIDILACLESLKTALENGPAEIVTFILAQLRRLTHDPSTLLLEYPAEQHNMLWDAIYLGSRAEE